MNFGISPGATLELVALMREHGQGTVFSSTAAGYLSLVHQIDIQFELVAVLLVEAFI